MLFLCIFLLCSDGHVSHSIFCRKSLALTYTEQEIKQWCEERRKNYPSKANVNKVRLIVVCPSCCSLILMCYFTLAPHLQKLTEKQSNSDVIDREAKMRREVHLFVSNLIL